MKFRLKDHYPYLVFFCFIFIYFYKFFLKGLIPFPGDITTGIYFPWLEQDLGYPAGVPVKNPLPSDIPSVIFPFKQLAISILKSGQLPDLNPLVLSGTPLLANGQSAIFYPLNLIYFLTDFITGWSLTIIFQPLLALITMYLLAREIKLNKPAAILAATTYAFSGFFTTWLEYNIHGHSMALLPAIFFFYLKSRKQVRYLPLYSLTMGVQILTGYPQFTLYTLLIIGITHLYFFGLNLKEISVLTVYTLLGIALSAIQLIPTFDFLSYSNRLYDSITLTSTNDGFFPFSQLSTLIAPNIFGNPATGNYFGIGFYDNFASYTGVISLVLTIFAIKSKNNFKNLLFLLLGISLLLSFRTPLSLFLYNSNLMGFGSAVASRAMFVFTFSISLLAGIGLDSLKRNKPKRSYLLYSLLILLSIWLIFGISYFLFKNGINTTQAALNTKTALRNLVIPTGLFLALSSTLFFLKKRYKFITFIIITLTFLDLFLYGKKYLSFVPKKLIYPNNELITFLQDNQGKGRFIGRDVIPMNMWVPYGLKSASGYDALYSKEYATYLGDLHSTNPLGRYGDIKEPFDKKSFHQSNTRYILVKKLTKEGEIKPEGKINDIYFQPYLETIFESGSVVILENKNALPFIYLDSNHQPLAYSESITGDIEFSVDLENNDLVHISTTNLPSWRATINGSQVELLDDTAPFITLKVPSGNNQIKLTYHERTFNQALLISISTLIFLVGSFLYLNEHQKISRKS